MLPYSFSIVGQIDWHVLHLREAIWSQRWRKANLSGPRVGSRKKPFVSFLRQHIFCTPGGTRQQPQHEHPKAWRGEHGKHHQRYHGRP
jgi:hypothetical protein